MHELRKHRSTGALARRGSSSAATDARSLIERAVRPVVADGFRSLESLEPRQLLTLMIDYRLDEPSDEFFIFDSAAAFEQDGPQDGTIGTATRVAGRVGSGALQFNGTQRADMVEAARDYLGVAGSLSFWIKTTQTGGTNAQTSPGVTGITDPNDAGAIAWGWLDDRGRIAITVNGTNGTVRSTAPVNTGTWQHVILTRDSGSGLMKVYVNGILQASITGPTGDKKTLYREFGGIKLGSSSSFNNLNGSLDEVRVYNHVVDDAEAAAIFDATSGAPVAPTGLAAAAVGAQGAELTWASTADDEAGFRIFTSTDGTTFTAAGTTGPDASRFALKGLLPNTNYTVRVVAFNFSGESAPSNTVTFTTGAPVVSTDTGTGLTGIYFDQGGVRRPAPFDGINDESSNFKGKIVIHAAEAVNFNWGNGAPDPAIDPNFFSSRWVGTVKPLYTDYYTFYTLTDDGGKLYINDELVIEDRTYHGMGAGDERSTEVLKPGGILLQAGQSYNIRMEQFEGDGGAGAILRWESINQAKEAIPASQLFPVTFSGAPTGPAVSDLFAESGPTGVTLTWSDPGIQNAIGFRLERRATGEAGFTEIARIAPSGAFFDGTVYPGKQYTYRIRAFNTAGDAAYSNEDSLTTDPLPTGPGLLGSYHDDKLLSGPAELRRVDATSNVANAVGPIQYPDLDNNPAGANLGTGIPAIDDGTNNSVRWEGTFTAPATGNYTFFTRTDDAVRFYFNGELLTAGPNLLNFDAGRGAPGAPGDTSRPVALTAGVAYPILYEYNQGTGGAVAELRWAGPGIATAFLPTVHNGQTILNATVTNPSAATNVAATPAGAVSANVTWNDNSRNEWANVIEQSVDGLNWVPAVTLRPVNAPSTVSNPNGAVGTGSQTIIGLQPTTTYHFRVRTNNTAGEAISANFATVTTLARPEADAAVADNAGDTNLGNLGTLDWAHWGHNGSTATRNASSDQFVAWEAEDQSRILSIVDGSDGAAGTGDGKTFRIVTNADSPSADGPASTASGGGAIYADEDAAVHDSSAWVNYSVTFDQPGMYRIYARVRHVDTNANGDGDNNSARQPTMLNHPGGLTGYGTFDDNNNVANVNYRWVGGNTLLVPAAGTYTFTWGNREGGFMTDRFVLHQNTGLGAAQLDALTTNRPGPISNVTNVGTGTVTAASTPGTTFTWNDGVPDGSVTATDDGIAVTGAENGFSFTVPALQAMRTLKVYVAAEDTTGRFTATMSDGSIAPFTATVTDAAGGGAKSVVYTINYKAEQPGQTLRIDWVNEGGTGQVILQGAALSESAPAAPADVSTFVVSPYVVTVNFTDASVNETGFRVERSTDGANWATIGNVNPGGSSFTDLNAEPGKTYQYRVVSISTGGETASAAAAAVTPAVPNTLPAPFTSRDIGTLNNPMTGSASYDAGTGTYTVQGSGSDIWNNEDHFHYMYRPVNGDVTMTARVTSLNNTDVWSKVGIMFREDLSNISQHLIMGSTPANGTRLQGRRQANYHSFDITTTVGPNGPVTGTTNAPVWVKLERIGDTFNAYHSLDGVAWTLHSTQTVDMNDAGYIGLAVSSHDNTELQTATFDNVTIVGGGSGAEPLVVTGTAGNDTFLVRREGAQLKVYDNAAGTGTPLADRAFDGITTVTIDGLDGDDTIILDYGSGDIVTPAGLTVNGGNGTADVVRFLGAAGDVTVGAAGSTVGGESLAHSGVEVQELGGTLGNLAVADNASARVSGANTTMTVNAVTVGNGAKLDLGTNDLLVKNSTPAALDALLASARNGATRWQGPGIGTSASTNITGLTAAQQGADTLLKYSYNGDVNGDGRINADDYFRIDQAFLSQPANPAYNQGDFNFDNTINADDYFLIDQAFLGQGAPLASGDAEPAAATASSSSTAVVASEDATKKPAKRRSADDSLFSSRRIEKRPARRR